MSRSSGTFLSDRQIEILKLRRQGLSQKQTAELLKTTRENINILERRAYRNIKRAIDTLDILNRLGIAVQVNIQPETNVLDVPRIVLDKADGANIKMRWSCIDILEEIRIGLITRLNIRKSKSQCQ